MFRFDFLKTYLLSKLLPLIVSPLGIVLILLLIFIFRKKAKLIYSAIIFLIVFSNGFFSNTLWSLLEHPWKKLDYSLIDSSGGIVVLSGGGIRLSSVNKKTIEWNNPNRFLAGINLYKANKSKRLIFTGGINPLVSGLPPEGDYYIREAILMGIPKKDLFTTYHVSNTLQEAKAIKKLFNDELPLSKKNIILVTSAFHMTRAKRVFEREGINVLPYPVDFRSDTIINSFRNPLSWIPNSSSLDRSTFALREIIGRIIYNSW